MQKESIKGNTKKQGWYTLDKNNFRILLSRWAKIFANPPSFPLNQ
jgi:hypothetical protein